MKLIRIAWRFILIATSALGFLFLTITFAPVLQPWIDMLSYQWTDSPGETLIILGGDASSGRILGLNSYWRAVYAVYEWRRGYFKLLVISGGDGVAEAMRDFVVAQGIPSNAVRLETRAQNTHENALFVNDMLRSTPGRKVLLASDYHTYRAYHAFTKCGMQITPRPFPDAGKRINSLTMRWPVFLELIRETTKIVYYKWRGWI